MTPRHYQYLFYSLLSFALSAYGFADKLAIRGGQQKITPAYFGMLFAVFGFYFFIRFMKTKFKQSNAPDKSDAQ
jgi:hypothetical protein